MATPEHSLSEKAYKLAHTPGLKPPPGVMPNFDDPYSHSYLVVDITIATLVVTTLFVAVRTYTKHFVNKNGLGWDDYLSILAWVGYVCYASVGVQVIYHGGWVHQWNVPVIHVMEFMHIVINLETLYSPVMFVTKLTILLQLMNIFVTGRTGVTYYLCLALILFNLLFYAAITFVCIFVCSPRAKFWDRTIPGKCVNMEIVNIVTSVINAFSDLVLLLLPIVCVWRLQMSMRNKVGVSAVFATGSFACLCSIMRIVTSVQFVGEKDITWGIMSEGLWALGEFSSGIIVGCMPVIPQFFRHFIPKMKSALSSGGRKGSESRNDSIEPMSSAKIASSKSFPSDADSQTDLSRRDSEFQALDKQDGMVCPVFEVSRSDEERGLTPTAKDRPFFT